jgi:hypothetical protein
MPVFTSLLNQVLHDFSGYITPKLKKGKRSMKGSTRRGLVVTTVLTALLTVGPFYAQEHNAEHHGHADATGVPEIFCTHMGTGQLCPGNAQMFNLGGAQKERYEEALNNYNKAVEAAQKQFLADAKDKVGLSQAELALAKTWFDVGLNPEINKILATKTTTKK